MKQIPLTQGQFALVDDEDYDFLTQRKWFAKSYRGVYYAERNSLTVNGKRTVDRMHRVILGLTNSKIFCDHVDRNTLNNQRANLRTSTNAENCANRRSHNSSTSKYLGVHWVERDRRWIVKICKNYKEKYVGRFKDEIKAALAYNKAAIEIHGQFANLNIIEETTHVQRNSDQRNGRQGS